MILNLKKIVTASALGLVTVLGTSEIASAQRNRDDRRDDQKQQEKTRKEDAKREREQVRAEQQRQAEWAKQNQRMQAEQRRQDERNSNDSRWGNGRWDGNNNQNSNRYRVYRNGSYYNTDRRGAELLRQAVNAGYQQGFQAARNDHNNRRRVNYSNSNIYQSGSFGYQSYVNRSQYQYYFRQGFQRGYQDGSNSRYQNDYDGQYQYGYNNNGSMSILGTILSQILNIQTY
jgi:hypothetical protein